MHGEISSVCVYFEPIFFGYLEIHTIMQLFRLDTIFLKFKNTFALKSWKDRPQNLLIIGPYFFSLLPKTALSAQTVESPYSFFTVSYTWYKSLSNTHYSDFPDYSNKFLKNDTYLKIIKVVWQGLNRYSIYLLCKNLIMITQKIKIWWGSAIDYQKTTSNYHWIFLF